MSAPGDNAHTHQGVVELCLIVDDWLKYDWDGSGSISSATCDTSSSATQGDNPISTATFGLYRGNDRIIYWREVPN